MAGHFIAESGNVEFALAGVVQKMFCFQVMRRREWQIVRWPEFALRTRRLRRFGRFSRYSACGLTSRHESAKAGSAAGR